MHISEGVLSAPVLLSGAALSAAGIAVGIRRLNHDRIPETAVLSAAFFTASLIQIPLGFTHAHLLLNGLCGIILGWAAFPAIAIALFLQAVLFGYGGLSALGVNTFSMAAPAVLMFFPARWIKPGHHARRNISIGFFAGSTAIAFSGFLVSTALYSSGRQFSAAAGAVFIAHIPIMILEGILTGFAIHYLARIKPDMFEKANMRRKEP